VALVEPQEPSIGIRLLAGPHEDDVGKVSLAQRSPSVRSRLKLPHNWRIPRQRPFRRPRRVR